MHVRRIILHKFRNFYHLDFDRSFEDDWSGRVPDSLLLIGPNGSGKTTLLNIIAGLWSKLYDFFNLITSEQPYDQLLSYGGYESFLAMEIVGLDALPVWIYADKSGGSYHITWPSTHAGSHRIRITYFGRFPNITKSFSYASPEQVKFHNVIDNQTMPDWVGKLADRLSKNVLGSLSDLPNMIFFESENRLLYPIQEPFSILREPIEYRWLATYEPATSRKGSIHNYLYNLKVVDETTFTKLITQANQFLVEKSIEKFDPQSLELLVKVGNIHHSIDELSSGEKQVLLMLAHLTRWLTPGGVVLIDEPDLHLHVSLLTTFVSHLSKMITKKGGQLILAAHSPELRKLFTDSQLVEMDVLPIPVAI